MNSDKNNALRQFNNMKRKLHPGAWVTILVTLIVICLIACELLDFPPEGGIIVAILAWSAVFLFNRGAGHSTAHVYIASTMRIFTASVIWLAGFAVILAPCWTFCRIVHIDITWGLIIALCIWSYPFYKTFEHFTYSAGDYTGVVLFNSFTNALTEVKGGFGFKYPQEKMAGEGPINLRNDIKIKNEPGEVYPTINGVNLTIGWQINMRPKVGRLVDYISNEPGAAEKRFRARAVQFHNTFVTPRKDTDIIGKKDGPRSAGFEEFTIAFRNIWGPPDIDDADEIRYGVEVDPPDIFDIDREEAIQKILAAGETLRKMQEEALKLMESNTDGSLTYAMALETVQIAMKLREAKTFTSRGKSNILVEEKDN